jgi:nucleotide-binding universal stress UspA family protein
LLLSAIDTMRVPAQALAPLGTRATVGAEVARINRRRLTRARKEIERATKSLTAAGWRVDAKVATGAPLRELIGAVGKKRVDLLVVGARGVTGIRHLLLGSVAEGALNRSPVPVLIVR